MSLSQGATLRNFGTVTGGQGAFGGAGGVGGAAGVGGDNGTAGQAGLAGNNGIGGLGGSGGAAGFGGSGGAGGIGGGGGGGGVGGVGGSGGQPGGPGAPGQGGTDGANGVAGADGLNGLTLPQSIPLRGIAGESVAVSSENGLAGGIGQAGANGLGGAAVTGTGNATVINAGHLAGGLSADGSIRANAVSFSNGGNRLEIHAGSSMTGNAVATQNNASQHDTFALGGSAAGTLDSSIIGGQVQGFTDFEKTGGSTWTLQGTTGERTDWVIREGALAVSADENLGSADSTVTLEGGNLRVTGTGYTTTGRQIITNGGGIDLVEADLAFTPISPITGSGGLDKLGEGCLLLNGAQEFVGPLNVRAGAVSIGENSNGVAGRISGDAFVSEGARLAGHGAVGGSVVNEGTLNPGSLKADGEAIGTFTIDGNYTQTETGRLVADLDGQNNRIDRVNVGQTANLAGQLHIETDNVTDWHRQEEIVVADGSVSGTFDEVSISQSNLDAVGVYTATTAGVDIFRNDVELAGELPDLTPNQESTAVGLDSLPSDDPLRRNVLIEGEANAPRSLDRLSGEIHAAAAAGVAGVNRIARNTSLENIRARVVARQDGNDLQLPVAPSGKETSTEKGYFEQSAAEPIVLKEEGISLWATAYTDQSDVTGSNHYYDIDQSAGGLFVGANADLGLFWQGSIAAGYGSSTTDHAIGFPSSAEADHFSIVATGGRGFETERGNVNLLLGAAKTWSSIETSREATLGRMSETLTADYDASSLQLFGEVGYSVRTGGRSWLEPFLGLAWTSMEGDGYQEKGGIAALSGDGFDLSQTTALVGLRHTNGFDFAGREGTFNARIGWEQNFGDTDSSVTHSFAGSSPFAVGSTIAGGGSALLGLGINIDLTENLSLGSGYTGRFAGDERDDTLELKLNWDF